MSDVVRLFNYFKPEFYKINITPNKRKFTFSGDVLIIGVIEPRQKILTLHAKDLKIGSANINGTDCTFNIKKETDELEIILPKNLTGQNLQVGISFSGEITPSMSGLYPCYGRNREVILATQFESHFARRVFPCVDEPEAKAIFSLTLNTEADDTVLANTLPKSSKTQNGLTTTTFKDTPVMPTYLLAFVIGNLKKIQTKTKDGVLVRAWATHDQVKFTKFALDITVKSLEFFNDYFEIPYPLAKCDVVAVPDFAAGAMENWGLITFRESCMLVDPANTSLSTKQHVAMTVSHEVAHQWFGNLVTMKWWNDLWLNEGFASWIEFLAVDKFFPQWHMWTEFIIAEQEAALRQDALKNTHPVEVHIGHPDEIHTVFDSISYSKGASVINMLHEYLGKNDFRLGLAHYLKKHSYQNTETTDLWEALEEVSKKPVKSFMHTWISQPGFPYVALKQRGENLEISQKRFFVDGNGSGNKDCWPVPLLSNNLKQQVLDTNKITLPAPKDLSSFVLNQGQSGFYITKYWTAQYNNLGQMVKDGKLCEADRLRLVTDSLALTKAGHLPVVTFLKLLQNFADETSSSVWDAIAISLGDIRRAMGRKAKAQLKPLAYSLSLKQVAKLGWIEKTGESYNDLQLRPTILSIASSGDNQEVIAQAKKMFKEAKNISDLPSNLRHMILITISRLGGKQEFNKCLKFLKSTNSAEDKVILYHVLCNFRGSNEYLKAINLIRSKDVRLQDVTYWIAYGLANPTAKLEFWAWLKNNWDWLKENLGSDPSFPRIPVYVARSHNDIGFLKQYARFFDKVNGPILDRSVKQGEEIIKSQYAWKRRDQKSLLEYLKSNS